MQTARIVQAVALMLIVALAASCAASKEYSSKLFGPKATEKDSQAVALKFLELDRLDGDKADWVSTDIIMGRDTASKTAALDNLAKTFPATKTNNDSAIAKKEEQPAGQAEKTIPAVVESKPAAEQPIAKNTGDVRRKKTREDNQ